MLFTERLMYKYEGIYLRRWDSFRSRLRWMGVHL